MKKTLAIILALVLVLSLATAASAANITIDDGEVTGASYSAYKLLNATDGGDDKIAYTVNEKYRTALQTVTGKTDDEEIIAHIAGLDSDGIRDFADAIFQQVKSLDVDATATDNVFSDVAQGYYLIVETALGTLPSNATDTYSLVMLDTAGNENVTITTKESVPTVDKQVAENNESTSDAATFGETADAKVGDTISYKITGTVSDKITNYKTYSYVIQDTMSEGLTFNKDAVVTVDGVKLTEDTDYTITETDQGFTITITDLKALTSVEVNANSAIVVTYTCTLNENAVSGGSGNTNSATITYSNNPYGEGTGTTPADTTVVFTYNAVVNKVDKENNALEGAGFTLYKYIAETDSWTAVGTEITGVTTFSFVGLDEGKYKLVETTVPAGYNKADDIVFLIESTMDDQEHLSSLVVKNENGEVMTAFTTNVTNGTVSTDVVNNSGTELPETGGIGTTLFYIFGGILVVGAVVLLVTKKRMSVN